MPAAAHDGAAGGEVGAGDDLEQVGEVDVGVVDDGGDGVADLAEVVRGEAGGHAHGDAEAAVDQQIGEFAGQDAGLVAGGVVVVLPIDGVELEVFEHVRGGGRHAGFGVAHRGGGVGIDAAEVALGVHEGVAHLPGLGHADEGGVDRLVAVGVVVAGGVADDFRALAVLGPGAEVQVVHRHEDAAQRRLEPVAHVGQGAGRRWSTWRRSGSCPPARARWPGPARGRRPRGRRPRGSGRVRR